MPPITRIPRRPRRLWTFSRDRLRLSSGDGVFAILFGLLFSTTGLFTFYAFGWLLLSVLGVLRTGAANIAQESVTGQTIGVGSMLFLGVAHFTIGTLLLFTLRVTFDRARDLVTVRSGWLGLRRRKEKLSLFQRVVVQPVDGHGDLYDIVLEGDSRRSAVVARVTRSHDLAREVAAEIAAFTGLSTY